MSVYLKTIFEVLIVFYYRLKLGVCESFNKVWTIVIVPALGSHDNHSHTDMHF